MLYIFQFSKGGGEKRGKERSGDGEGKEEKWKSRGGGGGGSEIHKSNFSLKISVFTL